MNDLTDYWYLTGPTASGKTGVSIALARRINAEIISLDSMAVYRGLDIGTAKPTVAERQGVPHHLIGIRNPDEEYSLAEYCDIAKSVAAEITARGHRVLFVGGTPLYLKGMLRGIFEGPPADWEIRKRLEAVAESEGTAALHAQLSKVDPAAAARLHPNDARRLIRALEVFELTGIPISTHQQQFEIGRPAEACRVFMLDWPRELLHQRINQRVEIMFADGLVAETEKLLAQYPQLSRTASQAVGYREVIEHLQGIRTLAETVELVQMRTRQFAKRQQTWFRSLSECRRIPIQMPSDLNAAVDMIASFT
ncbi:MAG: tRNA (adenosine(37)-N6)-dimethylallyltransferase MiaA [Planctomycetota bacterium]|nr:tRNA (adenosine(37)-N6)-dimethylallyltransferase MiaA [Planctomycetota bacterium]